MQLRIVRAAKLMLAFAVFSTLAVAQRVPTNYSVLTYRKVPSEKLDAFIALMQGDGKKIAQSQIASGELAAYLVLKLTSPFAAGADHNVVVARMYTKFPNLDPTREWYTSTAQKAGVNYDAYRAKLNEFGPATSQVITRTAFRAGKAGTGDFLRIDYHVADEGQMGQLMDMEQMVYLPMFKAVIDEGKGLKSWSLATPVLPTRLELGWDFYTVQAFPDSQALSMGGGTTEEVFKKTFPNRSYLNTMERVRAIDKITKVRVYHVMEMAGTPVMPAASASGQ